MSDPNANDRFEAEVFLQPRGMPGEVVNVVVDEHGLSASGSLLVARENLWAGGFEELQDNGLCRVLIVAERAPGKPHPSWSLSVPDRSTATGLLHATGLASYQRALSVQLQHQFKMRERLLIVAAIAMCMIVGALDFPNLSGMALVSLGFVIWVAATTASTPVGRVALLIGTDGIFRTRGGKSAFIPFLRAQAVEKTRAYVVLRSVDGKKTILSVDPSPRADDTETTNAAVFADLIDLRVREGIASAVTATQLVRQDFAVARGTAEIQSWLSELRTARRDGIATYRQAPPPDVDLDTLFADGLLDAQTRAGAAIALRAREGEAAAIRFRRTAATTASPALRVALEKIADGAADDEIARSIEKLR